jgi:hypothetical protein
MMQNINTKVRGGNVILNLDMERAYDRLNWSFIHTVLENFDFSNDWINLIRNCIEDINFFVLLNGSSFNFFTSSRGIR